MLRTTVLDVPQPRCKRSFLAVLSVKERYHLETYNPANVMYTHNRRYTYRTKSFLVPTIEVTTNEGLDGIHSFPCLGRGHLFTFRIADLVSQKWHNGVCY